MMIHSMTATFGKLEHETLTLQPGLNIVEAPNEWGKSTWCSFLLAMLYGLDTRAKSTRSLLADKDHYAPWSGSPMSGRLEIEWQGRKITIERTTKGRIPLGVFRAYETETGIEVPELTAENCGQMLLGVERSVFRRAGFIRLTDLPVSQDDALRRRLNALVTTGDESGDGLRLERGLRELKNKCRYNQNGLLPQAEQEYEALRVSLEELANLNAQQETLTRRTEEAKQRQHALENHMAALAQEAALQDAQRVAQAEEACQEAAQRLERLENQCASLPSREEAAEKMEQLHALRGKMHEFQTWQHSLELPPEGPKVPHAFLGMSPEEAHEQALEDTRLLADLNGPIWQVLLMLAGVMLLSGVLLLWLGLTILGVLGVLMSLALCALGVMRKLGQDKGRAALCRKYGSSNPEKWLQSALIYAAAASEHARALEEYHHSREEVASRREALRTEHHALCGGESIDKNMEFWRRISATWDALDASRIEASRTAQQYEDLKAMARPVPPPAEPDSLTHSREETRRLLQEVREEQQRLHSRLGEYRGRMETLGDAAETKQRMAQLEVRIAKLNQVNSALMLAQQTLNRASAELQRRFAPRIAKRAQELLSGMTGGKYDRLTLGTDFVLQAGGSREDTLRDAQWRSEGTIDQLYLALRLSVAEALTPNAPLILDDALVRFDDTRLKAALNILTQLSENRQVVIFTCQDREKRIQKTM